MRVYISMEEINEIIPEEEYGLDFIETYEYEFDDAVEDAELIY